MYETSTAEGFWGWRKIFALVVLLWAVVGAATFLGPRLFNGAGKGVNLGDTGTFGDTFGAVNSLFSALGVAGVAYALILQSREQRDARAEAKSAKVHDEHLGMISAMVYARSTLLRIAASNAKRAHDDFAEFLQEQSLALESGKSTNLGSNRETKHFTDRIKYTSERLIAERKELRIILHYAEKRIDWDRIRLPILESFEEFKKTYSASKDAADHPKGGGKEG